jgi:DNA-binding MarR family transcriptional regulator
MLRQFYELPHQKSTPNYFNYNLISSIFKEKDYLLYLTRPALKEIFKPKDQKSKDQVMYEAHLQYGYTLKEIAEYIGVHYTTVSRAIKRIEGEDEK